MPVKLIAPVTFAIVGLTTALFLNNVVLVSPNVPKFLNFLNLPKISLPPNLKEVLPKFGISENKDPSNFSYLITTPTPTSTPALYPQSASSSTPSPTGSPAPFFNLDSLFRTFNSLFSSPKSPTPTLIRSSNPPSGETIEISGALINSLINTLIPPGTPLSDLRVSLEEGKIIISGAIREPLPGNFTAEASITLINSSPAVKITKAAFGPLPIPTSLLSSLESIANQAISEAISAQNVVGIENIEITNGKIIISISTN